MAIFGRRRERKQIQEAARQSLTVPPMAMPVDCAPYVLVGLWPHELAVVTAETAPIAEYLRNDLQRIVDTANEKLRGLSQSGLPEIERRSEETRAINVARAFAILRVESTIRHLRKEAIGYQEYLSLNAGGFVDQTQRVRTGPPVAPQPAPAPPDKQSAPVNGVNLAEVPGSRPLGDVATRNERIVIDITPEPVPAPSPPAPSPPPATPPPNPTPPPTARRRTPTPPPLPPRSVPAPTIELPRVVSPEPPEPPQPAESPWQVQLSPPIEERREARHQAPVVEAPPPQPPPRPSPEPPRPEPEPEPVPEPTPPPPAQERVPSPAPQPVPTPEPEPPRPSTPQPVPPAPTAQTFTPRPPPSTDEPPKDRLLRVVEAVARQEPGLRWAAGLREDGSTLLVTDLAHGWVPSGISLPDGVQLLPPGRRQGNISTLLGSVRESARYQPGDPFGPNGARPPRLSDEARVTPEVADLGWQLGEATHWREGLPRLANTLAKAAAARTGVVEAEVELLRVYLDTARYQLLAQYPGVDQALLLNCLLLAATEGLANQNAVLANYHFAWFRALSAPQSQSRWSAAAGE